MDTQTILIIELITLILVNLVTIVGGVFIFKMALKEFKKPPLLPPPEPVNDFDINIENQLMHTKTFMELIQDITKSIVTLSWKNFLDEYDMNRITESRLKILIKDTADQVYKVIDSNKATKFTVQNTILKEDFYYRYIVSLVMNYVKALHQSQVG